MCKVAWRHCQINQECQDTKLELKKLSDIMKLQEEALLETSKNQETAIQRRNSLYVPPILETTRCLESKSKKKHVVCVLVASSCWSRRRSYSTTARRSASRRRPSPKATWRWRPWRRRWETCSWKWRRWRGRSKWGRGTCCSRRGWRERSPRCRSRWEGWANSQEFSSPHSLWASSLSTNWQIAREGNEESEIKTG